MADSSISATHSLVFARKKGLRLRRYFAFLIVLATLTMGMWIERETVLRDVAKLWIVSDPITPADAAVVLGGGIDVRPFVTAELYAKGLVKKVLVSEGNEGPEFVIG